MTPATHKLSYGTKTITYRVVRRDRRTLQISVLPDMSVQVIAPKTANDTAIRQRLSKRAPWILRQIEFFLQFHPKTPERTYQSGETHTYLGRRYRLKVVRADQKSVKLSGGYIVVSCPKNSDNDTVRTLVHGWQKRQARRWFEERQGHCLARFADPERVKPRALIIRQLKQRWGSMSAAGRLVLNRSLIQAAVPEIDYVITHELCHRVHHHHGPKFFELLESMIPDWEVRKQNLEHRLA